MSTRDDMMPLWTDAYLADTQDLSALQDGMYFQLMMRAWRSGEARLKDDERTLARIAKVSLAQWRKHSPAIMKNWELVNGYWVQKRLAQEWADRLEYKRQQSERGKKSAAKRQKSRKRFAKKPNENNKRTPTIAEADNPPTPQGGTPAAGYSDDEGEAREGLPLPPPDCPLRPLAESWQAESEALWSNLGRGLVVEGGVVFPESEVVFGALERRRSDIIRCGLRLCSRLELVQRMEAAEREPAVLEAAA